MSTEEMDDFGDLYADLEGQVNAGISLMPNIHRQCEGDEENFSTKAKEVDSGDKSRIFNDQTGGNGCLVDRLEASDEILARDMEVEDEIAATENGDYSDSEDDLHIVLNEEDGGMSHHSYGVGLGNSGDFAQGSDNGNEDDDLVIVMGTAHQNKDRMWADSLQLPDDGSEFTGSDRGISSKGGYLSQYSHYKYVRSHSGISSKTRAVGSGCVASFSSPTPGRCDWDVNGGRQGMVPCSVVAASNVANTADCQHGSDFNLPRNMSIFDVSIDSFEWKPWRNQGVDVTDFFNFGLNEENWKQYCELLEHYRKQTTMQRLDQPKGRAIRVEGGFGERRPSMDVRRPRHRDSDAVIQITMEGSPDDASTPDNGKQEYLDNIVKSENEGSYSDGVLDPNDRKKKELPKPDEQHNQNSKASFVERDDGNPPREDAYVLVTESASGDYILRSSSPSCLESHSDVSRDGISSDEVLSPAKKSSLDSVSGLKDAEVSDDCPYGDSRSNHNEEEREDSRCNSGRDHIFPEEQSCPRKLHSLVDSKVGVADNDYVFSKKRYNDVDLLEMSCKTKERKYDGNYTNDILSSHQKMEMSMNYGSGRKRLSKNSHITKGYNDVDLLDMSCKVKERKHDNNYNDEDLSSHQKVEMSITYESGRKRVSKNFHIKHSHGRRDPDPDSRINMDRRDYFLEKRATSQGIGMKQRDICSHERGQNSRGARGLTHKESTYSVSKPRYLYVEEDLCSWQRSVKKDDNLICVEDVKRRRHREGCTQEWHGKHMEQSDEEVRSIQRKYGRHIPCNNRGLNSPKKSKYDQDVHFKLNGSRRYAENDGKKWRHPDFNSSVSEAYREPWIVEESGLHDVIRPRNDTSNSRRSSEEHADHWLLPYVSHSYGRDHNLENGYFHLQKEATRSSDCAISSEEERYGWLSRAVQRTDDEVSFRPRRLDTSDSLFPCENRLKYQKISGYYNPIASPKFLNSMGSARKKAFAQGNTNSEAREENDALRRRGTVSRHWDVWEEKFDKRRSEVAAERNKRSDAHRSVNEAQNTFYHIKEFHGQNVVPPESTSMEDDCARTISSKVERITNRKSDHFAVHTDENWSEKLPSSPDLELEEGQLIEEPEMRDAFPMKKKWDPKETVGSSGTEANQSGNNGMAEIQLKDTAQENEIIDGYDRNRVLETLAKLERRRERFKVPIAPIKEPEKSLISQPDLVVVAAEVKQQRPTRKRRWVAN